MNIQLKQRNLLRILLGIAVIGLLASVTFLNAQVQSQTTSQTGQGTSQTTVERGEVVLVDGNDLIVKMEDGQLRHIANVPESARIDVDGQKLGIHDLKPGMKLQRTITTTSTPKTITTVQSVTGKVWHVNPPSSVILTLENGTNQSFKIPKGQKFNVDGQMLDAFGLKKGMMISATKVVEVPETVISQQRKVTGQMPPPPPPPPADLPVLVAQETAPTPPPVAAAETLPKTGSSLPLIGLVGLLSLCAGFSLRKLRSSF